MKQAHPFPGARVVAVLVAPIPRHALQPLRKGRGQ